MGSGNGERYTFIYSCGIRRARSIPYFYNFHGSGDKKLVREDINLFTKKKRKKRARSFYLSSLELITSSGDPLSNRLHASAPSKRCIIEETINASIPSAQAIVSHDIITLARGKPEILPTENDIRIYIYIRE